MINQTVIAAVAATLGLSGSIAMAKGHDQGVADGSRIDPSILRGGIVASHDIPGVGRDVEGNFLGVADSSNPDLNYGRTVVAVQREQDTRRVKPVVGNGANSR